MKLAIVGDVTDGKEERALHTVRNFIEDHHGGNFVVMSAGSVRLIHCVDRHALDKGYSSIILGNASKLAVLNADKVLLMQTKGFDLTDMVALCKENNKPYMLVK